MTSKPPKFSKRDLLYQKRKCVWQGIHEYDIKHGTLSCLVYLDRKLIKECEYKGDEKYCTNPARQLI